MAKKSYFDKKQRGGSSGNAFTGGMQGDGGLGGHQSNQMQIDASGVVVPGLLPHH